MKQITIKAQDSGNFTPAGLMARWAKENKAHFKRNRWGESLLVIEGVTYRYHHWKTDLETATLFLLPEAEYNHLANMCRTCGRLEVNCKGSTDGNYIGCPIYGGKEND